MRFSFLAAAIMAALPVYVSAQETGQADQGASSKAFMTAQETMMKGMMAPMTGNADQDFARMMMDHHQGAIDMAKIELQYGKDAELRKMADKIIQDQGKEIKDLKSWQDNHMK